MDARGVGAPDSMTVWGEAFGMDGKTIPGATWNYAPETDSAGFRARSPSGSSMVGAELAGRSHPGPPRKGGGRGQTIGWFDFGVSWFFNARFRFFPGWPASKNELWC